MEALLCFQHFIYRIFPTEIIWKYFKILKDIFKLNHHPASHHHSFVILAILYFKEHAIEFKRYELKKHLHKEKY